MKKFLTILPAVLLLTGCGKKTDVADRGNYYAPEGEFPAVSDSVGNDGSLISKNNGEKLVYTSNISMESTDYTKTVDEINELMKRFNAITQNIDEKNNSRRVLSMVIRVPAASFDDFIQALRGSSASITGISTNVDNITTQYDDNEIRIAALEKQHARLLELLDTAASLKDVIEIEDRLSEVEIELTRLQSYRNKMDTDVAYSTIRLSVYEVTVYSEVSFLQKILNAFSGSWSSFTDSVQGFTIDLIYALPHLILLAVAILVLRKPVGRLISGFHWPFGKKEAKKKEEDIKE